MTGPQQGLLLLSCRLGDPQRKPLTPSQLRLLRRRLSQLRRDEPDRELTVQDLTAMGYDRAEGERIVNLLSQTRLLRQYLRAAEKAGCQPVLLTQAAYPAALKQKLGTDCATVLWAKGDLQLLNRPAVSLVGSREPAPENSRFAIEAGQQAARQGYVLVSGNARGADALAQEACLAAGGQVISVLADSMQEHPARKNVLYLSEESFDAPFSAYRALRRNRLIHALGRAVLVAQCTWGKGGTWDGTLNNLRHGWTPVFCFRDGSDGIRELCSRGAWPIEPSQLACLEALRPPIPNLFENTPR